MVEKLAALVILILPAAVRSDDAPPKFYLTKDGQVIEKRVSDLEKRVGDLEKKVNPTGVVLPPPNESPQAARAVRVCDETGCRVVQVPFLGGVAPPGIPVTTNQCPCVTAPGGVGTCGSYLCPANGGTIGVQSVVTASACAGVDGVVGGTVSSTTTVKTHRTYLFPRLHPFKR